MRAWLLVCVLASSCVVGEPAAPGDPAEDSTMGAGLTDRDVNGITEDRTYMEARVCPAGETTFGIDVSYYQSSIDWNAIKNAGVKFVFVRLSDGDVFQDPKFNQYWTAAKQNGIIRGAYQFFRPNQSITAQADKMIAAIGTYTPGDLPPVIDVEATGGLGPSAVASRIRTWVDRVKNALKVDPIVYTGKYFWRDQVGGPSSFVTNPLWIAQYTSLCPDIPSPWQRWTFWQNSESGHVSGISGNVDMDKFNGSLAELQAFANSSSMPPPANNGCTSATLNKDVPEGTCVQAASDQKWYRCVSGAWSSITSTTSCATTYAWCSSATLGRNVAPRTCVQARSDNQWYQCDGKGWAQPVDPIAESGPIGLCSATYQL